MLSKLSLSAQLDIYSPGPVTSNVTLKLPSPNVTIETHTVTCLTKVRTLWLSFLAALHNCRHSS